jgi:hypothetical protein
VADLITLLQGGSQGSAAAVVSDLQALLQTAGSHGNNGLSALLGDLQTAAGPATPTANQPAQNAPVSTPQAANTGADLSPGNDVGGHHFGAETAHHFHHMWG